MYNTIQSLTMDKNQELIEVLEGRKRSALGYWENLPDHVRRIELFPIPGRYYQMGIALTQENLDELILAYYMPISPESDRRLGRILSYDEDSINWYISTMDYNKNDSIDDKEKVFLKFKSFIEKNGLVQFKDIINAAIQGDKLLLSIFLKEFF